MAAGVMPGGHLFYPCWMARYAKVRALSPTEAAYVAGIVDGEGTVTLTTMHVGENRRLVVSVSSTERYLLEYLVKTVGAGQITSKRTYSSKHAPSFTFRVTNRQALDLLQHITPYLQTYKRLRAALALRHYLALTPRNGKYRPIISAARAEFERSFLALRSGPTSRPHPPSKPPAPRKPDEAGSARYHDPKALLKADKKGGRIVLDDVTILGGIPPEVWAYKLGNRSALEWILDQYKERKPKDPTIREKFDTYRFADYKDKVIDLLPRVTTVSVRTVAITRAMKTAAR